MIKSIIVTNPIGESLEISMTEPEKSGFIIQSVEGIGPAKANINMSEIATFDGRIYNSALLNERTIQLKLQFIGNNIEEIRLKSYHYFPIKKKVRLLFITDSRRAYIDGYVENNGPSIFSKTEGTTISIVCPNPYFTVDQEKYYDFSGVDPVFEFPFEGPNIELGSIATLVDRNLIYNGDSETGVHIKIHALGTVRDLVIYNRTKQEAFSINTGKLESMTGHPIIIGDDIDINTVKGQKGITLLRDGVTTNILNAVDRDSSWFQLQSVDNIFTYTTAEGSGEISLSIRYNESYEGI